MLQGDRFALPEVWMVWTSVSHFAAVCVCLVSNLLLVESH